MRHHPKSEANYSRREVLAQGLKVAGLGSSALITRMAYSVDFSSEPLYDYIVVGSGAGGGPLCANLALAGFKVLLVEAGGSDVDLNYLVPAFNGWSAEDLKFRWDFYVNHYPSGNPLAQADTKWVPNQGILYPRAATLGGCTAHNAMITMYPDNSDWDYIARLTEDSSWASSNMWQYFQKVQSWLSLEQPYLPLLAQDPSLLSIALAAIQAGGAVQEIFDRLLSDFAQGNVEQLLNLDPNLPYFVDNRIEGVFLAPKATKGGVRNGSRERIKSVQTRFPNNLFILNNALASKILFNEGSTQAIGIEYLQGTHLYAADPQSNQTSLLGPSKGTAKLAPDGEIILAGGAFNSPQLLMLSGIGPSQTLNQVSIAPLLNRPGVGMNLQDRYEVTLVHQMDAPFTNLQSCRFGGWLDPCLYQYLMNPSQSVYSSNGVVLGIKKRSSPDLLDPDLFIFGLTSRFAGYYPGWPTAAYQNNFFTWSILKGHTNNTAGLVTLKSNLPTDTPNINFNYFSSGNDTTNQDLKAVIEAVKFTRSIKSNSLFQDVTSSEILPGPTFRSDEEISQYVQTQAWGHHASCSNKMGLISDPNAVVDSSFRVIGAQNLRIVDASVFPKIPGLFLSLPVYMISEKASEVILAQRKKG